MFWRVSNVIVVIGHLQTGEQVGGLVFILTKKLNGTAGF